MASDATINAVDYENRLAPEEFIHRTCGPYGRDAAPVGGFAYGPNDIINLNVMFDRQQVIDYFRVRVSNLPTSAMTIQIVWVADGQSAAAALAAGQIVCTSFDLQGATNRTMIDLPIDRTQSLVPARSHLVAVIGNGAGTGTGGGGDGTYWLGFVRARTQIR